MESVKPRFSYFAFCS